VQTNRKLKIEEPGAAQIEAAKTEQAELAAIYDLYYPHILNYLYRKAGDTNTAQELTADTFFQLLKSLPRFKYTYPGCFTSWVYTIALNIFRQSLRARKTQLVSVAEEYFLNQPAPENELAGFEREYDLQQDYQKISAALSQLSENDSEIIRLHFIEQLSYKQIARILGMREVSLRSRVSRSLAKLREILQRG
jgi:RNA polymerase sigma-70 factor (ECF subfamily)